MKRPRIKKTKFELVKSTDQYFRADYYCRFKENGNDVQVYIATKTCLNTQESRTATLLQFDRVYKQYLQSWGLTIPKEWHIFADHTPYNFIGENRDENA